VRSPLALVRDVAAAVRFLTVISWPGAASSDSDSAAVARAAWAFPCVGLLVGGCSGAAGLVSEWLFGPPLQVVAAVAASVIVTGGLHLDGLADSADALFSWRSREKKLEILHDSRIGTMGVLALFLVLATKLGALHALGPDWWQAALLAPVWGRWSVLYGTVAFPLARPDGLGAGVRAHLLVRHFVGATVLALAVGVLLLPPAGALVGLLVFVLTHVAARAMTRSLGGLTGDTYGALSEIAEVTVFMTLVALQRQTVVG
jgi:adenosylcobinamide-GDP ribazoletransferase